MHGLLQTNTPERGPYPAAQARRVPFVWEPGGRITVTSGTAVTTADVTGAVTVYYTPYLHNIVPVWSGREWEPYEYDSDLALSVAGISNATVYDIFLRAPRHGRPDLALGPAWSSATARATAGTITRKKGRWTLGDDRRWLFLGTIYASGAGTVEDSAAKRFVWNANNRVLRHMMVTETTASWTYNVATLREARGQTTNRLQFVIGVLAEPVYADILVSGYDNAGFGSGSGIGVDSTTVTSAQRIGSQQFAVTSSTQTLQATYEGHPGIGYHFLSWLESGNATNAVTYISNAAGSSNGISGIGGRMFA